MEWCKYILPNTRLEFTQKTGKIVINIKTECMLWGDRKNTCRMRCFSCDKIYSIKLSDPYWTNPGITITCPCNP